MSNFVFELSAAVTFTAPAAYADVTPQDGTVISDTPTFIATYIARSSAVVDLIKTQTADSKAEDGNTRFEGLHRIGRDNHFVILEASSKVVGNIEAKARFQFGTLACARANFAQRSSHRRTSQRLSQMSPL